MDTKTGFTVDGKGALLASSLGDSQRGVRVPPAGLGPDTMAL